ncbi:phage tail-collar fiber domain-containing protein [Pseudomonas bohemica]|uniref:phage tail-collar fiber domain-containing protein n=2 Tax=Pseudomonas TaxID=286 RepID=UPI000DA603A7
MTDQTSQFFAILTNIGVAKQANADALGIAWKITQMGVGDANGTDPQPDAKQKSLIREWRRAPLNELKQDPSNPAIIIAEQVIPAEIGGNWIREIGLYDADGDLVAVANCAPSYKPTLAQGSGRTQVVRMNLIVSNTASVELKIDPSVVLATREFVLSELAKQDFKSSVMACAPGSIVLSGLQTIDGVAVPAGKRVLAPFQTAAKDRGIWVTSANAWTRATDADTSDDVTPGMLVLVEQGTLYGDSAWQLVTDAPITLGVTALTFEMAWGRTGVAPGEYRSVTVDKYGRVLAANNPTTVAGYGLTDVYTKTQIDSALQAKANTASPTFTGIAKAPTPAVSNNSDQIATTAFVQAMFTALIGAAPETLNQINEIAAAMGNDPNFAATVMTAMAKLAPQLSPIFTGDPRAPTPALGDNDTSIATTAFVQAALRAFGIGSSDNGTGNTLDFNQAPWGSFIKAEGVESDAALYNRPVTGAAGNAPVCFDVLTFGLAGRTTQHATQLFAPGGRGRTFTRVQHDSTWFPWREIAMTDSPALLGAPTAPTVPFNTENAQLANMQALGDAKQGWRGVGIGYTASAVLNPTSVGRWHRVTVAGVTLTLPSKSEVEAGKALAIHNASAGNITIKATGTEVIAIPGGGSSMTLAPNEWVQFAYNSDAIYLPGGRGKLVETAAIDSPVFIGDPRAPTAPVGDSDTTLATTAFVQAALAVFGLGTMTGPLVNDLNTTVLGGLFRTSNTTVNQPMGASANMSGIVIPYNNGGCLQIAALLSANGANARIFFRTQAAGGWSYWREFGATDSPVLTGNPTCPTPAPGDSSKSLATTEFVRSAAGDMVGMVGMFAMPTPPDGWLKRNGAAVSRTTYAALFARIGTLWGAGDGSTTFNLPDARGYFDRAWDDARGIDPSRAFATNQATQNQSHGHSGTALSAGAHGHTTTFVREMIDSPTSNAGNAVLGDQLGDGYQYMTTDTAGAHTHTLSIANSGGNESRPPNQAYLACIKF